MAGICSSCEGINTGVELHVSELALFERRVSYEPKGIYEQIK